MIYDYALFYAIPCMLASIAGSNIINNIIAKTGKNSILVFCLFYVMIVSLIILPINGIRHAVYDIQSGINIFEIKSYCS